jgi:hypothetical protein
MLTYAERVEKMLEDLEALDVAIVARFEPVPGYRPQPGNSTLWIG